jgi:hypothetical protein
MKNIIFIFAALSSVIPVILLYMASFETPWEIQTWDGTSEKEIAFRQRRRRRAVLGFIFLGTTLTLQIIGILCEK